MLLQAGHTNMLRLPGTAALSGWCHAALVTNFAAYSKKHANLLHARSNYTRSSDFIAILFVASCQQCEVSSDVSSDVTSGTAPLCLDFPVTVHVRYQVAINLALNSLRYVYSFASVME